MLKFLTHKLRTHSINEDPNHEKVDDDHDSGTESDDEFQDGIDVSIEPSSPMASSSSPGLTDSAVPSDTDFGCPPPPPAFALIGTPSEEIETNTSKISISSLASQRLPGNITRITSSALSSCKSHDNNLHLSSYNDQHSSEEELEVINSPKVIASQGCRPATAPEKRKWSQVNNTSSNLKQTTHCNQSQGQQGHNQTISGPSSCTGASTSSGIGNSGHGSTGDITGIVTTCSAPVSRAGREPGSGSSDEEVQGLLDDSSALSQPVQFRTSPPVDAHKPGRSQSPPPKLFHASTRETRPPPRPRSRPRHHHLYHLHHHHHHHHHHQQHHFQQPQQQQQFNVEMDIGELSACSPRKRHRPPHRQPRPCLDFEKMQQLKARAVTAWRHSGEHGSELSVFCW
ncbi:protein disconnected-like [Microplitis mediator]|uniref:protein disconnected-like n=1 Tax=Microplitis mediator TaxID=375433 RepID=UPI002553E8EF|nr:protein disconnected-like [Microplitis mediator]